jgi:hypothetical protein
LGDIWKSNLIISGLNSLGNSDKITQRGLQREFNYVFSNTQIKPKWYQNSWIVWPLVLLTLAIGGSVIWLSYFRKKKTT